MIFADWLETLEIYPTERRKQSVVRSLTPFVATSVCGERFWSFVRTEPLA